MAAQTMPTAAVVGRWVGAFELHGRWTPLNAAEFHAGPASGDAALGGTLESPEREWPGASPLRQIRLGLSSIRFEVPLPSGVLVFDGALHGDSISGTVHSGASAGPGAQASAHGRFHLARVVAVDARLIEAYTGTYRVAGDHDLFLGGLLGDTTFTYHDFRTGRIGALHPSSETTFFAGPALFRPAPPELHVTFLRCPGGQVDEIRLRSAAGELAAVRLPVVEEEVTFHNGAVTLAGTLMLPPTAGPHPAVVLIHGSGRQTRACVRSWADYFVHRGIAALIYDKRGAGASTRGPEWYEDLAGDAVAGLRLLQHHPAIDPRAIGLWGSSQGGWIAPLGAVQCPDVAFIVLMAGPAVSIATQNVQNVACSMRAAGYDEAKIAAAVAYTERLNELWPTGQGWEELKAGYELAAREGWAGYIGHPGAEPPRPPTPEQRRRRHHEMHREPAAVLERVRCPVLALFGEQDTCVPPAGNADLMAAALQRGGNPDYTVKVIPGANHLGYVATPDGSLTSCTHFIPQYHQLAAHWIRARAGTRP